MKRTSQEAEEHAKTQQKKTKRQEEAEVLGTAFQGVDVKQLMGEEGPEVKCVVLRCGEEKVEEEVTVNMSPRLKKTQELLGGSATFLGQWEDLEVILMISSEQEENKLARNLHKLQPPFHNATVFGDILLTRSDDNGYPQDFTLKEYEEFKKLDIKEWEPESPGEEEDSEEDDEEDDDSQDDEEDDDEDGADEGEEDDDEDALAVLEILRGRLVEGYVKEYGREPSAEELEELMSTLTGKLEAVEEGDEEEEDDEDDDVQEEKK